MKIDKYVFPEDLYYDKNHFWARREGDVVTMGLTDYAQSVAGEIIFFEAPRPGKKVEQGKPFASIESGKWVGRVYAVASGEITEVNGALEDDATIINKSPYGDGWLVKIKMSNPAEMDNLLKVTDAAYQEWLKAEMAKNKK